VATISSSMTRAVSSRSDRRANPGGGSVQASAAIASVWAVARLGFAGQAGQALGAPGGAGAGGRAAGNPDGVGDRGIGPGRSVGGGLGEQQDPGALRRPGGLPTGADEPSQGSTVIARQADDVLFAGHRRGPFQTRT